MQKYQKATKEETVAYLEKGRVWVRSNTHFSSCRGVVTTAIAEFLANRDGKTIYCGEDTNDNENKDTF